MISVLFARRDSIYKTFPDCDVWDIDRDALNWLGGNPVVAHPPCRSWGNLKHFAKPRPGEKELAIWAVDKVRKHGGVLEHPKGSSLWTVCNLPRPGDIDEYGGWTLPVNQSWFGHRAEKATFLYIVGCKPKDIPDFEIDMSKPTHVINNSKTNKDKRPEVTKSEREHTPIKFAKFLMEIAVRSNKI